MHFPPVANAMDYLVSVVRHLKGEPAPRDLKYAVLHLQAASEVLIKARLLREHWSLVFKEPGRATRRAFEAGDFESCGTREAIDRLRNIVGITIDDKTSKTLNGLAKSRNALQHYGLTEPAGAIEARTARVLDFLLDFYDEHLYGLLDAAEQEDIRDEQAEVLAALREIKSFVRARMDRLRPELEPLKHLTVQCFGCLQWAWVMNEGLSYCYFCGGGWTAGTAAYFYAVDFLGLPHHEWRARNNNARSLCPRCNLKTLVPGVHLADAPESPVFFCFNCHAHFRHLASCPRCDRLFLESDGRTDCGKCGEVQGLVP